MSAMGGYRDEYEEDLDEYEDEEADGERYEDDEYDEDGYEEEEDPKPSKEVQDYLVLRQRLKEEKRKQLKKELGTGNANSREKKNSIIKSKDNYGSFFGSSQPVIAQRVIQESKSLLENPHLLEKAMKSKDVVSKSTVSASGSSKSQAMVQTPKVTNNGMHKKVQMIKHTRDYSFLECDADEPHEPAKDHPRKVSAPKSETHMAQLSERNRDFLSTTGRKTPGNRDDMKSTPVNGQLRPKVGGHGLTSVDRHMQTPSGTRKQPPVSNGTTSHDKKPIHNKIGSGPGRPMVSKSVPSKFPVGAADKRISMPAAKSSTSHVHKPTLSKPQHPVSKQSHPASKFQPPVSKQQPPISKHNLGRREHEGLRKQNLLPKQAAHEELRRHKHVSHEELRKQKPLPRQGAPVLKPKVTQPPPRSSARPMASEDRNRKRPMKPFVDDDDDLGDAIKEIRSMFKYNPAKYRDADIDDRDMEASLDEIRREEKRSARIARQEDEEERLKIEAEEERERLRRESKKRKLH